MIKLTEVEKKYTFKKWLSVLFMFVSHPIRFVKYIGERWELGKYDNDKNKKAVADLDKTIKHLKKLRDTRDGRENDKT